MGRTTPTYRRTIDALEREWQPMRRALRREYQADFDRLFDRARGFADAAGYVNPADPTRAFVLSVLLAHEVDRRTMRERLDALEAAVDATPGGDTAGFERGDVAPLEAEADETEAVSDGDKVETDGDEAVSDGDEVETDGDEVETGGDETETALDTHRESDEEGGNG